MRSASRPLALVLAAVVLSASSDFVRAERTWSERSSELLQGIAAHSLEGATAVDDWVRRGYQRRPAVIVGLAAILTLPPLALAGWFLYRRRPERISEWGALNFPVAAAAAYIDVDGAGRFELTGSRDLLQIGRHDDNDVCLEDESVHRYHAVIERSASAGFIITDLSGPAGAGLRVNGKRQLKQQLSHGDTLELGNARMRFEIAA